MSGGGRSYMGNIIVGLMVANMFHRWFEWLVKVWKIFTVLVGCCLGNSVWKVEVTVRVRVLIELSEVDSRYRLKRTDDYIRDIIHEMCVKNLDVLTNS